MSAQAMRWAGWALSGLFILFMLFDVGIKWLDLAVVDEAMLQLGYSRGVGFWIGVLEAVPLVLYVVPRTSVLGAVLFMGVFGGAIEPSPRRRSAVEPRPVRRLPRRGDVGRTVAARPGVARGVSAATGPDMRRPAAQQPFRRLAPPPLKPWPGGRRPPGRPPS